MRKAFDTPFTSGVFECADTARRDRAGAQIQFHHLLDSGLIVEGVRRILGLTVQLEQLFSAPAWRRSRLFLRSAGRLQQEIQKIAGSRRADKKQKCNRLYHRLVTAAMVIVLKAYEFKSKLDRTALAAPVSRRQAEKLLGAMEYFLSVILHLACLVKRQIVDGETISPEQKILSLFALHQELIKQGKFPYYSENKRDEIFSISASRRKQAASP